MVLEWMNDIGTPPPNYSEAVWERLPESDKEEILAEHQRKWPEWLAEAKSQSWAAEETAAEEYELALLGLPMEGLRAQTTALKHGFGMGKEAWAPYPGGGAAQYLNLRKMFGHPYPFTTHKNLCGQLTCIAAMGKPLKEGLELFASMPTTDWDVVTGTSKSITGADILKNVNYTTWFYRL